MELRISSLATENHRFRRERQRLEERVTCAQVGAQVLCLFACWC